ncbi:MAG: hypothetical protein JRF41_00040 [Deltaproteobacteria bacterium]|nr:hypothetical protein [Deltaproteobacteria bacterium]
MKKFIIPLTVILLVAGAAFYAVNSQAYMNPYMSRPWHPQGSYCPNCGMYLGPGMMGQGMGYGMMGRGMGQGMMGQGMGYGMMGRGMGPGMWSQGYRQPGWQKPEPLKEKDVKSFLENYLKAMRNPNLKLGQIKDAGEVFEVEILTKEDSLVDKVIVDKYGGGMRSFY